MKIVLDTNILIATIGRRSPYRWIFELLVDGKLSICVSTEILLEYREILERKANVTVAENVANFIAIHPATVKTSIYFNFQLIDVDPDDNKFVDCYIASNADVLISNDNHFQMLKGIEFPKIDILTLGEFESRFRSELV